MGELPPSDLTRMALTSLNRAKACIYHDWTVAFIVDAFEEQVPAPDAEYVEEQLLQIMSDEFETELEDDSAVDVAKDVVRMWVETHAGDSTSVLKFETHADKFKGKKVEVEVAPADGEEDWEEDGLGDLDLIWSGIG